MGTILDVPLGTTGDVVVSESAGILTITGKENFSAQGISVDLSVNVSSIVLLKAWSAATTTPALKAILDEAAIIAAALPA